MNRTELEQNARKASALLKSMANERRLLILCHLAHGEKSVGELEELVGLSQSALSQHLARLRRDRLVMTRRAAQTIFYSLAGRAAGAVMETLYSLYCDPMQAPLPPETVLRKTVEA
jgi:DNA-binding transcriptional ArsR family regulator